MNFFIDNNCRWVSFDATGKQAKKNEKEKYAEKVLTSSDFKCGAFMILPGSGSNINTYLIISVKIKFEDTFTIVHEKILREGRAFVIVLTRNIGTKRYNCDSLNELVMQLADRRNKTN
ncbi:hypothetical protein PENTCL1PPCAC_9057, partial [Pristionchus entomophagus]